MPLVSIIICIYNGEKYIDQCLESVFNQTYKNIEIIVVDDGSTDKTKEILLRYAQIKYIYQPNKGLAGARNTALQHCKGHYITMLDVDDLYTFDKIEKQVAYLESHLEMDIVYNDAILIDELGEEIKVLKCDYKDLKREDFLAQVLFRQIVHCTASMMFKKKCFEAIRFPEYIRQSEDYYVTIELAKRYRFGYLEEALYKYRRHLSNLTNDRIRQQENEIDIIRNIGIDNIKEYVMASSLSSEEKILLYGKILFKIRKYEVAITILQELQDTHTMAFYKYFYIGNAHYMMNEYVQAAKAYKSALQFEKRAELYNNIGVVSWYEGRIDQAQDAFREALKIRKEYMDPSNNLKAIQKGGVPNITQRELRENLMRY